MPKIEFDEELSKEGAAVRRRLVIWSIVTFLVAFVSVGAIRFLMDNREGAWICRNGEWVQVGHPIGPPPMRECVIVPEKFKSNNNDAEDIVSFGNYAVFVQKGNLVRGLPKLDPGKIYLAYNPRGVRMEIIALEFDNKSICAFGDEISSCSDSRVDSGLRVRIRGQQVGDSVLVHELETLTADEL